MLSDKCKILLVKHVGCWHPFMNSANFPSFRAENLKQKDSGEKEKNTNSQTQRAQKKLFNWRNTHFEGSGKNSNMKNSIKELLNKLWIFFFVRMLCRRWLWYRWRTIVSLISNAIRCGTNVDVYRFVERIRRIFLSTCSHNKYWRTYKIAWILKSIEQELKLKLKNEHEHKHEQQASGKVSKTTTATTNTNK